MTSNVSPQEIEKYRQLLGDKKTDLLIEAFHPDTCPERQHGILKRFHGALLVRAKLKIREFLNTKKMLYEELYLLLRLREQVKAVKGEARYFLSYRIKKLTEAIEILKNSRLECRQELANIGRNLLDLMNIYDNYATLHDKAQILNVHHSKLEQIVAQQGEAASSLYQLVFIYRVESSSDRPFFEALLAALKDEVNKNQKMKEAVLDKLDELFPNIPKYQVVEKENGVKTLKRIPPNLKVINSDGSTKIIRRWKLNN